MSKLTTNPPWIHSNYRMISILLFFPALFILSALYITVPLIPVFAGEFHISLEQAAWSGSAFSLFFAFGCLLFGPLSDKLGRKRVMVLGLAALSLATLGTGLVSSFPALIVFRCIQGAVAATFSPVALTYAGEVFPTHRRVSAIGMISAGFLMAGILGQVWASYLNERLGWHAVFLLLAAVYGLTFLALALYLPSSPASAGSAATPGSRRTEWRSILANRYLWLCYSVAVMLLLCFVGMYTVLGSFLHNSPYELSNMQVLGIRAFGMIGMLCCFISGPCCARWGSKAVLRSGLLLAIAAMCALSLVRSIAAYTALSAVFVAGIAILVPSLISLVGDIGSKQRATATSLYTFILFAGASLGPIVSVYALDIGPPNVLPFLIFAGLLTVGLINSLFIKLPGRTA
ncbi:MFS transporter [Paenibacillus riograndensis]|uniref:Major facilitator superfamily MFS_1 n=1 Tax=Paenibacillus riograndensis SBR5 TaxID=1073571 RepID=A0A0E4HAM1_9BACL|nr:MFS transporter [Paenibacillus riograndensis]CQR55046.1 Major facilitator superfamily MFS_1 [Paenibacillus riograndensis SBR5]